ncbi:MAG: hypothetical protein A3G41_07355 [Elusimicrobia bacterium RIFCSPLOWO2_12_FULL_59_9]|nr:MAG: hypothetical protein A3G41_07355 [Elusimicrobia bacterium RIFCSPLOWO2_12_FULL_59_9]
MQAEEISNWLSFLKKTTLFSTIAAEDLAKIAPLFQPLSLSKGSTLFQQGETGDTFYLITSGRLRMSVAEDGRERTTAYLGPGDSIGEMSLLTGEPRLFTGKLETTCEFLILSKQDFDKITRANPSILLHIARILSKRLLSSSESTEAASRALLPEIFGVLCALDRQDRTLFCTNLALNLTEQTRKRVLLVDLSQGGGEIAAALGLKAAPAEQMILREEDFRDPDILRRIGAVHPSGLEVLTLEPKIFTGRLVEGLFLLTNLMRETKDFVLFCMADVLGDVEKAFLQEMDQVILVNTPEQIVQQSQLATNLKAMFGNTKKLAYVWLGDRQRFPSDINEKSTEIPWNAAIKENFQRSGSPFSALIPFPKTQRAIERLCRNIARLKVGLAMGAGGALGFTLLGIWKTLQKANIEADVVAGTSIGSLVGASYCAGIPVEETIEKAHQVNKTWLYKHIFLDMTIPRSGLLGGVIFLRFLRSLFGHIEFGDLEIPFACAATDIMLGEEVVLRQGRVAEAVRASCSIPIIFQPFLYRGRFLVDGGLINPVPTKLISQMGADVLISVNLTRAPGQRRGMHFKKPEGLELPLIHTLRGPHIGDVLFRMIYTMEYEIAQSHKDLAHVTLQPDVRRFSWTEFHRAKELIHVGEQAAEDALDKIKDHLPFLADTCPVPLRRPGWKRY